MSRQIKFRVWGEKEMKYNPPITVQEPFGIDDAFALMETHKIPCMQYTGLKDKNGKEIYEGDLIDYAGLKPLKIEWRGAGFVAPLLPFENSDPIVLGQESFAMFAEIIGNIYENPELVEHE